MGRGCFPVPAPAPLTLADKILSPSSSLSPKISPHPHPKRGGSPRIPVPVGKIAIPGMPVLPNYEVKFAINFKF